MGLDLVYWVQLLCIGQNFAVLGWFGFGVRLFVLLTGFRLLSRLVRWSERGCVLCFGFLFSVGFWVYGSGE